MNDGSILSEIDEEETIPDHDNLPFIVRNCCNPPFWVSQWQPHFRRDTMLKHPIFLSVVAVVLLASIVLVVANRRFGSILNAAAYFDGHSVIVDRVSRDLGTLGCREKKEVELVFTNLNDEDIVLAGASCECVVPPKSPITLRPFEETSVVFDYHAPPTAMNFETLIEVYFDGPISPVQLTILGASK
jgi:hypothetical protein